MKRSISGKESWTLSAAVAKKKPKDVSDSAANGNLKPAKLKPGPLSWKSKKLDQIARADFADIDDLLMTDSEDDDDEEETETKEENEEEEDEVVEGEEEEEDCYSDMETSDLGTSNIFEIEMKHDESKGVVKFIVDNIVDKAYEAINKNSDRKKDDGGNTVGKKATPQRAECDICGQTVSLARLTVHKRLPHQFACTKINCHKKFTIVKALERHMRASHDENDESEEDSSESHSRAETPSSVPVKESTISPEPSSTPEPESRAESTASPAPSSRTASRISSVDSTENSNFACKLCGEKCYTESRLSYHYFSPHLFQCPHCDFSFNTRITMENHVSLLHNQAGIIGDDTSCHLCGETFKRSSTLERHRSSPHEFPCKFCDKRFQFKKQLTKHNSTFHKGQKLPKPPKKERKRKVNKKDVDEAELQDEDEEISPVRVAKKRKIMKQEEDDLDDEDINKNGEEDSSEEEDEEEYKPKKKRNIIEDEEESDDEEITPVKRGRKRKVIEEEETSDDDDEEEEEIQTPIRARRRIRSGEEEESEEEEEILNGNDDNNCDESVLDEASDRNETPDNVEETEIEPPSAKGKKKTKAEPEDLSEEFTCNICDLIVMGKKKFTIHEKKVHKFPCDVEGCSKKFIFKGKLGQHKKSAHTEPEDKTYVCEQCGVRVCDVKTKPEIASGKMDRHNALPHSHDCQSCELKFVSEERRDFHSSKTHDTDFTSELVCKMCRKSFESEKTAKNNPLVVRNFLNHLESPHDFGCDECEQTFTTKQFLKKHEEDDHAESLGKQQCSMCGIEILKDEKENAKTKLKTHESRSHPHDCEDCDFHFTVDLRLKHHENIKHGKENKIELSCALCGKEFDTIEQLFDHSEMPHGYPCKFCEKEFTKKGLLTFHLNSNHKKDDEEDVFSCDFCDEEFLRKEKLDAHVESEHKEPLICTLCKEDFGEDNVSFENHIKIDHTFACEECDVSYTNNDIFKQHKRKEHPKVCNLCEKDFEDALDEFEEHKTFKHEFDCNRCDLKYVTKSLQEAHSFDVHGVEDEEDTQCGICQLNFKVSKFRDHLRVPHRWGCHHCRLKFSEKESLDEHVTDVHDVGKNKAYACKFCEVEFKDKEKYKDHKSVKHKHDCSKCDLKFTSSQKLQEHSLDAHGKKIKNLKKITCNLCGMVCDKKFDMPSCKDYYLKHVATPHKFSCKRCDLRFTVKGKLDKHMIEIHTGESSGFECKLCGYYFSHKKLFDDHEGKIHRYKCRDPNCENKFISEDQLEKHCSKKHQEAAQPVRKERDYNCHLCGRVFKSDSRLESHLSINHEFGCNYCSRRYTVDVALSEHVKTVHKIEDRRERERKGVKEEKPKRNKNSFLCSKCRQEKRTIQEYRQHIQMSHSYNCNYCQLKFTMKSYLDVHIESNHMEAVVMGMMGAASSETPNQQDVAANRRLARQTDNALTWLRSKFVRDHLYRVMAGKGHSARHRMFMTSSIREECCRTDQSKLFKLSNQSFLSFPPTTDATALSIMEQIYMSGPPVFKDLPRNKFMFEYITCVLLPDAWLLFLIKTKGLNPQDAEAAFFKGGSELEQRKLFDLDMRGWIKKEEIKNWTTNSVPQDYKPRDDKPGENAIKPPIERQDSSSGESRIAAGQAAGKLTPNRPQFTPERSIERTNSWEGRTTPIKTDMMSPQNSNHIKERRDSNSGNGRITPNKTADPRQVPTTKHSDPRQMTPNKHADPRQFTPNKPDDPRQITPIKSADPRQFSANKSADPRQNKANKHTDPRQTKPSNPADPRQMTPNKTADPRQITTNKSADPRQNKADIAAGPRQTTPNKSADPRQNKGDPRQITPNKTVDPRQRNPTNPADPRHRTQKNDHREDPRKLADSRSDNKTETREDTKNPKEGDKKRDLADYGLSQESIAWLGLNKEKSGDLGKFIMPESPSVENARDHSSANRDRPNPKWEQRNHAHRNHQRSPSVTHERKADFGGAFRDSKSPPKPENNSDLGSGFRDPRSQAKPDKNSDFGSGFGDPRSQAKPDKNTDFGSSFRDPRRSESHHHEKRSEFGDRRKPESFIQQKGDDFGGAFRDSRKPGESNQQKSFSQHKNDNFGSFRDSRKSEEVNKEKKSDFGNSFKRSGSLNEDKTSGAFRDPRRSESLNLDKKSDFGGAFRDPRRSESLNQEKKSDSSGAFRDPRSQVKQEKKPDFLSTFKEVQSEKKGDQSSRDPRRLIKPSEGKNDSRDPRKAKESKDFYENYY